MEIASLDERARYATYAWLSALRSHWPPMFERELGRRGERLMAALAPLLDDDNRILKLRRIALARIGESLRTTGSPGTP